MHAVKMLNFIFGIVYCRVGQRGIMKSIIHHIYHFITGLVDHIVWIHGIVVRFHKLRHFFVLFCYKNLRKNKQTNNIQFLILRGRTRFWSLHEIIQANKLTVSF